ncbi:LURP-one-related family protein [Terrisporobacter glycolicus]|uniref:LURP-one-related family protein n=1 Tax=Terrisporobacter glycolicus TaxID=36841 RepID=UPI0012B55FE9|nr:LURP-one-related family protein [Terrisporobacter glycolicus]
MLFKDKLSVTSKYGDLTIKGDYFDHNYGIYKGGELIAQVAKEFFSFTDNYYIDIYFEDESFVLALVVIIDKQKNNN